MRMMNDPDGLIHGGVGIDLTLCGQKAPWVSDLKREVDGWSFSRYEALQVPEDLRCPDCYEVIGAGIERSPNVQPGDEIHVPTALYMSHGADDFLGGKARVSRVTVDISAGQPTLFVSIEERPGSRYNWAVLSEEQSRLATQLGDRRSSRPDPDYRPEFNRGD